MSLPITPRTEVFIALTTEEWRQISHEINYLLSRAQELQEAGRLPACKEDDGEAIFISRALIKIRVRDGVHFCIIPDERTPGSSSYSNFGEPAYFIPKVDS